MAIPIKRFEFLDEQTNLAIADVYSESNTDILNSPMNELKTMSSDIEEFLGSGIQSAKDGLPLDTLPNDLRISKDSLGNLADVGNLLPKDWTSLISSMLPDNPLAQSDFSQMSSRCKQKAGSRRGSGKPYGTANSCGAGSKPAKGSCGSSSKQFGKAMNKATGGAFTSDFLDLDGLLSGVVGLSSMGYDMNLCNVFGSLATQIPNTDLLSKASGSLIGGLNSSGNVMGMLDLASSSTALNTKAYNPSTITGMLSGFNFPKEIKQSNNSNLAERFTGAMEIFDGKWNQSGYDGILSTQGVQNSDMGSLMQQKALDNIYDSTQLNIAPADDYSFLSTSF